MDDRSIFYPIYEQKLEAQIETLQQRLTALSNAHDTLQQQVTLMSSRLQNVQDLISHMYQSAPPPQPQSAPDPNEGLY